MDMSINAIRHKKKSEIDAQRSASLSIVLMHFIQAFAILGVIFPILLGVDYFCAPLVKTETVINKYYKVIDNLDNIEYRFFTNTDDFLSDISFYNNTNIGDPVTYYISPIFKTVTLVSHQDYKCNPKNIYGLLLIIIGISFISSICIVCKTWGWKRKMELPGARNSFNSSNNFIVNWGIINAVLCLISLLIILSSLLAIDHFIY